MNLELLDQFRDPYMKTPEGRGALLAGVLLGYIAYKQVSQPGGDEGQSSKHVPGIDKSPLFKQLQFGRLDLRSLKRLMARVPTLIGAYRDALGPSSGNLNRLCAKAGEMLLEGKPSELGVDGNFAFTIGFTNSTSYYWRIFGRRDAPAGEQGDVKEEPTVTDVNAL